MSMSMGTGSSGTSISRVNLFNKRGYRKQQTDAVLAEYLAAALLYRSDWRKSLTAEAERKRCSTRSAGRAPSASKRHGWPLIPHRGLLDTSKFAFYRLRSMIRTLGGHP
jgi:hypothetical protein